MIVNGTGQDGRTGFELLDPWGYDPDPGRDAGLTAIANEAIRATPAADILGSLSVATFRHADEDQFSTTFRSGTLAGFGGAEFRHAARTMGPGVPLTYRVEGLADAAARFVSARDLVLRDVSEAWLVVARALAASIPPAVPARVAAIGVHGRWLPGRNGTSIDLVTLGDDLLPGIDQIGPCEHGSMEDDVAAALLDHARRVEILVANRAAGHRVRIASSVPPLLDAARMDLGVALGLLERRRDVSFRFGQDRTGRIVWSNGVLGGEFEDPGHKASLRDDLLSLAAALPATFDRGLIGQRLGDLIENPLVPRDAIIIGVERDHDIVALTLRVPTKRIGVGNCHVA